MNVEHIANDKLVWYVPIYITLAMSAVAVGYLSKITSY